MIGVYKILCTGNGRCYIGSSVNIKKRWGRHVDDLKQNKHHCAYLQRSWNKYGEGAFTFNLLCCVLDVKHLLNVEQYFIDRTPALLNSLQVAGSSLGVKWSEEQKTAQSKRMMGRTIPKEVRAKMGSVGAKHHSTFLKDADVIAIIERVRAGESQSRIAGEFGLSRTTINDMVKRRSWVHLCIPPVTNVHNKTSSKLTALQVKSIKVLFTEGKTTTEIAKQFSVSFSTIADIRKNRTWQKI